MKLSMQYGRRAFALLALGAVAAACGDTPTGPDDAPNPALVAEIEAGGFGAASGNSLPQGSANFTGPGGMRMDATGKEFFQQLTWNNGVVWRTSGFAIAAVPDESVLNPVITRLRFGVGHPGSLASIEPGTYDIVDEFGPIDFTTPAVMGYVQFRTDDDPRSYTLAEEGRVTITSVEYFADTYTCELLDGNTIRATSCEYQIGLVRGTVEFSGTLPDGTPVVQPSTDFTLPIKRETVILVEN